MSFYRQQLESFLAELDVKASRVYDIGGSQLPVRGRTKSWEVSIYKILDLPAHNLETPWAGIMDKANIIFCLEVFEYLIDPTTAIKNIAYCLKDGGKAYISAPLVYPVHNEVELDSLRYTENGFKRLCDSAGLKVTGITYRYDRSGFLQQFYAADKMHPAKGMRHDITGYIFEVTK